MSGIVQGVGFRPFVYSLAQRHRLAGWVRNDSNGVQIEVEGERAELEAFLKGIETEPPPLAVVENISWHPCPARDEQTFHIEESREGEQRHALVSPDVAVCEDCLREMFDPSDRRFRYPFINCTNCGPRFTITRSVPYDRAMTTMSGFSMCPACLREYEDPTNRRFHAQPSACPICGPQVRLTDPIGQDLNEADPIRQAAEMLLKGAVIAVKGLGGYHLACNPLDPTAVGALRGRKARQDKPLALMAIDAEQARILCRFGAEEEGLLTSAARPIVLLERREDSGIADAVAPRQKTLGVMLAYTPLHHLLLRDAGIPLVMTSGNRSDEPIAYQDEEALAQLGAIADAFLTHNRPIHIRCDDSVVRLSGIESLGPAVGDRATGERLFPSPVRSAIESQKSKIKNWSLFFLRRSRGHAPAPLNVAIGFDRHVLACGGELKNTFCVAKENHVFLSHHIGDLENYETLRSFREGVEHFCRLFDVQPEVIAYDIHPEYLSTKYAREREEAGMRAVGVQHHHAHIASCLADNERPEDECVIGVALDGTGYGTDGAIWGGEFLTGSIQEGFMRAGHLEYLPLPGGEAAIRQPWRMALAQLIRIYGEKEAAHLSLPPVRVAGERNLRNIARLLEHQLNTPMTSSAGRLFDAVSAILGVPGSSQVTYEGQAAIELELTASDARASGPVYPFQLQPNGEEWVVETAGILRGVTEERLAGRSVGEIAFKFHQTLAEIVVAGCMHIQGTLPPTASARHAVALSGGTFQNQLLLGLVQEGLTRQGFTVYRHRRVPANDGGLCLGQAVLANRHSGDSLPAPTERHRA